MPPWYYLNAPATVYCQLVCGFELVYALVELLGILANLSSSQTINQTVPRQQREVGDEQEGARDGTGAEHGHHRQ